MPRVRVCVNVRVCAFFAPLRSFPDSGNLSPETAGCTLERKIACPLPSRSLLVAYKEKKVWTSFYLLFCLLFDSHFTIAIQGRDGNFFPVLSFSGTLSPVFWASCFVV